MPDIKELAERLSHKRAVVDMLGQENQHTDPEKKIKQDARYRLAWDAYMAAEKEYRDCINGMTTEQLTAIAH